MRSLPDRKIKNKNENTIFKRVFLKVFKSFNFFQIHNYYLAKSHNLANVYSLAIHHYVCLT